MTEQSEKCPECGGPIEAGKPCPNCLLKMALQPTGQLDADLDDLSIPGETTDGQPKPAVPDIEAVRKAFPQLEIIEMIGRGGMGTVFKARQPKLDRFVALKILAADLAAKPAFADRFAREGKLLARLSHPNIVSVYDYGQADGFYYLILEYVDGVNLRQAMREQKFSPEQALSIVPKICDALQYAHDEGVLHRDIKPENILLDTRGRIKITDFGIGKLTEQSDSFRARSVSECPPETANLTNTGQILGTPNYMAPEQIDAPNTVDHRADIYSLGVVFYELLTGELPKGRFPMPSEKTPVGVNVDEIVLKALQRERDQRYQTAGEMKTSVETASQQFTVPQALPPETAWDAFRKVPLWMFLFAFFALMFVLPSLVNLAAIVMDFFSGDFNKKWADVYFAPIPLLIFITIVWIMRHWQIRPAASSKEQREAGTEHPSSLKIARIQNRNIFPIIAIIVLGYAIPVISQLIGASIFQLKPWFIGLDLPAIFFWGLLNMIAVGTAIILFRASRTWWEPLRYFSVIGGYGVLAYYYSWFDIASDAQAAIGLIFIPIFAIPGFIGGFFTGCFLDYLITRSRRRQEPQGPIGQNQSVLDEKKPEFAVSERDNDYNPTEDMKTGTENAMGVVSLSEQEHLPPPEKTGLYQRIITEVKTWPTWATVLVCIAVICFGIPALISIVVIVIGVLVFLFGDLFEAITGYHGFL